MSAISEALAKQGIGPKPHTKLPRPPANSLEARWPKDEPKTAPRPRPHGNDPLYPNYADSAAGETLPALAGRKWDAKTVGIGVCVAAGPITLGFVLAMGIFGGREEAPAPMAASPSPQIEYQVAMADVSSPAAFFPGTAQLPSDSPQITETPAATEPSSPLEMAAAPAASTDLNVTENPPLAIVRPPIDGLMQATPAPTPIPIAIEDIEAMSPAAPELPEIIFETAAVPAVTTRADVPAPSAARSSKREPVELIVEGIFWDTKRPMALLNDNVVEVGTRVSGARVVRIEKTYIVVETGGEEKVLRP